MQRAQIPRHGAQTQPAAMQCTGGALYSPRISKFASPESMLDAGVQQTGLARRAELSDNSALAAVQRRLADIIDSSPRVVTQQQRLDGLRGTAGQRQQAPLSEAASHVGEAVVQRKWNPQAKEHISALPPECEPVKARWKELLEALAAYEQVDPAALDPSHLKLLAIAQGLIGSICESLDALKHAGEPLTTLRFLRTEVDREEDRARYQLQRTATTEALKTGVPSYLNITPTAGDSEALSTGKEGKYGDAIPVSEQYRATTPSDESQDLDITIDGPGGVIDLLVVSGGHGGVEQLFETSQRGTYFSADWWKRQVSTLQGKNIKARLIVLDACLSASLADVFSQLLSADGKLVGYVHSIPQMVVTDKVWKEVHDQGGASVEEVIDARIGEVTKQHAASRHGTALEATVAVAVYEAARGHLRYDEQALDPAVVAKLSGKEQTELGAMKRNMVSKAAKEVSGYVPSVLGKEGGTVVTHASSKTVPMATLLSTWFDDTVSKIDTAADVKDDVKLYNPEMTEVWKVLKVNDATNEVSLEKT